MNDKNQMPTVPVQHAGKWIVWSPDGTQIVGVGETPEEARLAAEKASVKDGIYEWAPPADERLIGGGG